jgi:hypothetical protein
MPPEQAESRPIRRVRALWCSGPIGWHGHTRAKELDIVANLSLRSAMRLTRSDLALSVGKPKLGRFTRRFRFSFDVLRHTVGSESLGNVFQLLQVQIDGNAPPRY